MLFFKLLQTYTKQKIRLNDLVGFTTQVSGKSNTKATQATLVRHECYTNDTSATRVKSFDFDNDKSKNMLSHPYIIAIWQIKGYKEKNKISRSYAKMRLKSAPQKLNFAIAKAISKSYTLDCSSNAFACSCVVTHNNTASFSIKSTYNIIH